MKNAVILASHIYSGSTSLLRMLAENPRVQSYRLGLTYDHPTSLNTLIERPHKCPNRAAVYVDEVLFNHLISSKRVLEVCRFVYLVREPRATLNGIVGDGHMPVATACRYYCYRLRRLCEMARRTPGAVLLTHDDAASGRGNHLLEEYLMLKKPLIARPEQFEDHFSERGVVGQKDLEQTQRSYERYLYYLRNLPLRQVT